MRQAGERKGGSADSKVRPARRMGAQLPFGSVGRVLRWRCREVTLTGPRNLKWLQGMSAPAPPLHGRNQAWAWAWKRHWGAHGWSLELLAGVPSRPTRQAIITTYLPPPAKPSFPSQILFHPTNPSCPRHCAPSPLLIYLDLLLDLSAPAYSPAVSPAPTSLLWSAPWMRPLGTLYPRPRPRRGREVLPPPPELEINTTTTTTTSSPRPPPVSHLPIPTGRQPPWRNCRASASWRLPWSSICCTYTPSLTSTLSVP